jgi:hypothetical protein
MIGNRDEQFDTAGCEFSELVAFVAARLPKELPSRKITGCCPRCGAYTTTEWYFDETIDQDYFLEVCVDGCWGRELARC